MEIIQSLQNPLFKEVRKLVESRRERLKSRRTLLDGPHLLASWLDAALAIDRILLTASALQNPELASLVERAQAPISVLDDRLFGELTELPSPSGILGLVAIPASSLPRSAGFCLLLDGVQDPGNVGSILRTAVAAGVDQVLLSSGCADVWSPKTLRAGMGAQAVLDIVERADLLKFAQAFDGRIAVTMLDGATDLFHTDLTGNLALALGAEGGGVSPKLAAMALVRVKIPMMPGIESLNVGAAAAICLYEHVRQSRNNCSQAAAFPNYSG